MFFATLRIVTVLVFRFLGWLVYCFSKKRKPISFRNVNLCFPEKKIKKDKRNNQIVRDSFISLGHNLADFLLLRFYNKKNVGRYVEVKNKKFLDDAISKGKGLIFSGAHFGSWELAANFLALKGLKSLVLYNPIKKPLWLEKWVKNNREHSGNILIAKQNSLLKVYRHLKGSGSVIFMTDQHCIPKEGVRVNLFNNNVWMHNSFIHLSLRTGAPIISCFIHTNGLKKYTLEFSEPIYPSDYTDELGSVRKMAELVNKNMEKAILKSPGQWMWQHRRFKS